MLILLGLREMDSIITTVLEPNRTALNTAWRDLYLKMLCDACQPKSSNIPPLLTKSFSLESIKQRSLPTVRAV